MRDKYFDELYEFVKKEIMHYDNNQSLPPNFVVKLRGLSDGNYISNRNIKAKANYSFEIILTTFKLNKYVIDKYLEKKDFKDETAKFNYVLAIVRNNINDVYLKYKKMEINKSRINNVELDISQGAGYKKKADKRINKKIEDLW